MSLNPSQNPCTFKTVCRQCKKVQATDRPEICKAIECEDYDPCPRCGMNRTLHDAFNRGRMCKNCHSSSNSSISSENRELKKNVILNDAKDSTGNIRSLKNILKLRQPGIPPDELGETEKEYYITRWKEYEGYYRNPAAYFNCHQLILLEIHSTYLNAKLIEARGELQSELSREMQVTIALRKNVTDQLPEKEAEDVMDDEKSLAMIHELYIKEKKLRSLGPVSRVFRQDTLALAPNLFFPIDPKELLEKCGFKIKDIEEILPKIKMLSKDKTPEEVLEFFGFSLNEEFAMKNVPRDFEDFDPEEQLLGGDLDLGIS